MRRSSNRAGARLDQLEPRRLMTASIVFFDTDNDSSTANNTAYTDTAIHVLSSDVDVAATSADPSILKGRYHWNFGDTATGAEYNELDGFNAAHVYTAAGTYTVTLTVTNPDGTQQTPVTSSVTIAARSYASHTVYVDSAAGNDANDGSDTAHPVKTVERAEQRLNALGDGTQVLFKRGGTYPMWEDANADGIVDYSETLLDIEKNDVLIGAYGTGAAPKLAFVKPNVGFPVPVIAIGTVRNVTIQDLDFDTDAASAAKGNAIEVNAARNVTIRGNTFTSATMAVNAAGHPGGMLVLDNTVPATNGLTDYFAWLESGDTVFLGNTVNAGALYGIRCGFDTSTPINRLLVAHNDLRISDRSNLRIQAGSYAYVDSNTFTGASMETGPQDDTDGEARTSARLRYAVVTANSFDENGLSDKYIRIDTGAEHILYKNNTFVRQTTSGQTFLIDGIMGGAFAGRSVKDINIVNNTVVNNSTGNALSFAHLGANASGYTVTAEVTIANNLYVAPNLALSAGGGILVIADINAVASGGLSHNVWPDTGTGTAMNIGGTNETKSAYLANHTSKVSSETFSGVTIDSNFTPSSAADAAAPFQGIFVDKNGMARPSSGTWTTGAIQRSTQTPAQLTGTGFGTAGSWNNSGNTFDKALDGDTNTYFDAATSQAYVGLDFGSAKRITSIQFTARFNLSSRMVGGVFEASNDGINWTTTLYTVSSDPGNSTQTVTISDTNTYRYVRYLSPVGGYGNIAEMALFGY